MQKDTKIQNDNHLFDSQASSWWDKQGPMRTLHDINPERVDFIQKNSPLQNKTVLDIGCGGGILSEALSQLGAQVIGLDISTELIEIARAHSHNLPNKPHYIVGEISDFAAKHTNQIDVITCLELLEHVPSPELFIQQASVCLKPGGSVFFSTINRSVKAFLTVIVASEYLFSWIPKQTHQYEKFIQPAELDQYARKAGLSLKKLSGMHYNPFSHKASLQEKDVSVNYLAHYVKKGGSQ